MRRSIHLAWFLVLSAVLAPLCAQIAEPHRFSDRFAPYVVPDIRSAVRAPSAWPNGIVVAGNFETIGGVPAHRVALWTGAQFQPLGPGLDAPPSPFATLPARLAIFDEGQGERIYASGSTTTGGFGVYRFDGAGWQRVGLELSTFLKRLVVADDGNGPRLYALNVTTLAGVSVPSKIVRLENGAWVPFAIAAPVTGTWTPNALVAMTIGGVPQIVVGFGANTDILPVSGVSAVCRWTGTEWVTMGTLPASTSTARGVQDLALVDFGAGSQLFAAGSFFSTTATAVARWTGSQWVSADAGVTFTGTVSRMAVRHEAQGVRLYANGTSVANGAAELAIFDGSLWNAGTPVVRTAVRDLLVTGAAPNERLILVGPGTIGDRVYGGIAMHDGTAWQPVGLWVPGVGFGAEASAVTLFDCGNGPELVAGGRFITAGQVDARHIARFDGDRWNALPTLETSGWQVSALGRTVWNGVPRLIAGGPFVMTGGSIGVAAFDGASWSAMGSGLRYADGFAPWIYSMSTFDDGTGPALYVGGSFEFADDQPALNIARWNGSSWASVGPVGANVATDFVRATAVFDDGTGPALYVGGHFETAGGHPCGGLARLRAGQWEAVGTGVAGPIRNVLALRVIDLGTGPALYIGGEFTSINGVAANNIARYDAQGFAPLGSGITGGAWYGTVAAIEPYDDGSGIGVIVAGNFTYAGGSPMAMIARWRNGWSALGQGIAPSNTATIVYSLCALTSRTGPGLAVAGIFETAGGYPSRDFAFWQPVRTDRPSLTDPAASGTVGENVGGPFAPLTVDGRPGLGHAVFGTAGQPMTIAVATPPMVTATGAWALFLELGAPSLLDVTPLGVLGWSASIPFAPMDPLNPVLATLADSFGVFGPALIGAGPTPWTFVTPPLAAGTAFTLQGIIGDPTAVYGFAVTNAVTVRIEP